MTDLAPTDTADAPYYYTFKVQCTSCRETHSNWVGVNRHVGIGLFLYDSMLLCGVHLPSLHGLRIVESQGDELNAFYAWLTARVLTVCTSGDE